MQDVPPVEAPVGGAPDLGAQEMGQAEGIHDDQCLWESWAAGPAEARASEGGLHCRAHCGRPGGAEGTGTLLCARGPLRSPRWHRAQAPPLDTGLQP